MQKFPVYNNHTPLKLSQEDTKYAKELIMKICSSMSFFDSLLDGKPDRTDAWTHMGLFESYFGELAKVIHYESIQTEERENRNKELREANQEILRLESLLGKQEVNPDLLSAKLREHDNVIRCFYGAMGFRYASLQKYTAWGILYDFSPELEYQPDDGTSGKKEWIKPFSEVFPLIARECTEWDIERDKFHAELLDTDKNKEKIFALFEKEFPGAKLFGLSSRRNDFGSLSLSFSYHIPYQDIDALKKRVIKDD